MEACNLIESLVGSPPPTKEIKTEAEPCRWRVSAGQERRMRATRGSRGRRWGRGARFRLFGAGTRDLAMYTADYLGLGPMPTALPSAYGFAFFF